MAVAHQHLGEAVPEVSSTRTGLPRGLDSVIAKALAKSPDDRYQTCGELLSAARTVFEVSGYELHDRTGSGGRIAVRGATAPPSADALGSIDPQGTNATQTLGTMGTAAPPREGSRGGNGPEPLPPAWAGHPVAPPMARRKRKLWPWLLMAVIFLSGLGVGLYFVLTRDTGSSEPDVPNFLPRPSSVFPDELPAQIDDFRKIVDRLDKVEANKGFTDRLGALYKNDADQQVFHSIVRYPDGRGGRRGKRNRSRLLLEPWLHDRRRHPDKTGPGTKRRATDVLSPDGLRFRSRSGRLDQRQIDRSCSGAARGRCRTL